MAKKKVKKHSSDDMRKRGLFDDERERSRRAEGYRGGYRR